jgi:L-threonylcarbamoyladenylate synthase
MPGSDLAGINTVTLSDSPRGLRAAAALLNAGALVAFPTETVYGLGADARQDRAVAAIFAAKGRPAFNPLIVHVTDLEVAERLAAFDDAARALAARFWPGPLTLVLPRRAGAGLSDLATAGLPSVALRVPAHPLARRLLAAFGGPLAAPSANPSGRVSPTTRAHVLEGLGGRIAAVLEGGACPVGLESTILGFEEGRPVLLRPGGLPAEAVEAALGRPLAPPSVLGVTAPGQLASHYAPRAPLRLDAAGPAPTRPGSASVRSPRSPGPEPFARRRPGGGRRQFVRASARRGRARAPGGPRPHRRRAHSRDRPGRAINDRLRRAAAPRP